MSLLPAAAVLTITSVHSAKPPSLLTDVRPILPVAAMEVVSQTGYERTRSFVGRIEVGRESEIGFISGGRLDDIQLDEGDHVEAGAVVAHLNAAGLKALRAELVAEQKAAEAQLERTRSGLKRQQRLVDQGATSHDAVEKAREQFHTAEATVELASARIDSIDVDLERTKLRAPYAAVVTQRFVDEGRVVAAGEPILKLQEVSIPEVRVGIAGPLLNTVTKNQQFDLMVKGERLSGRVKAILPVRGTGTRTVDVILSLDTTQLPLRSGDLVTLNLEQTVNEPGYWLPIDALAEGVRGLWTTYLLKPADAAGVTEPMSPSHAIVPYAVEVLHATADRAYVRGTLPHQALIVASGLHRVVPGQQVRLAERSMVAANAGGHSHDKF